HFRHVDRAIELAKLRHCGGVRVGGCIHAHPVHKRVCEGLLHHSISCESTVLHGWSTMPTTVHTPWPTSIRPKPCGNIRALSISALMACAETPTCGASADTSGSWQAYRMTSAAWERSVGGIVSLRAWAALRLMMSSNFITRGHRGKPALQCLSAAALRTVPDPRVAPASTTNVVHATLDLCPLCAGAIPWPSTGASRWDTPVGTRAVAGCV